MPLSVYDARKLEIPACASAALLGTVIIWTPSEDLEINLLYAAAVWAAYAFMAFISAVSGSPVPIGMGDAVILSILSLHTGGYGLLVVFAVSGVLAGAFAALLLLFKKADRGSEIPYAPFLTAGYAVFVILSA